MAWLPSYVNNEIGLAQKLSYVTPLGAMLQGADRSRTRFYSCHIVCDIGRNNCKGGHTVRFSSVASCVQLMVRTWKTSYKGIKPSQKFGARSNWDYSVDSYSGIIITEHTEYQFPKEQTLCFSENRIADVTKIKATRPRKSGYAIFPPKDGRQLHQEHDYRLLSIPNKPLFRLYRQFCYWEQNWRNTIPFIPESE